MGRRLQLELLGRRLLAGMEHRLQLVDNFERLLKQPLYLDEIKENQFIKSNVFLNCFCFELLKRCDLVLYINSVNFPTYFVRLLEVLAMLVLVEEQRTQFQGRLLWNKIGF